MLDGLMGIHGRDLWPIRCRYSDVRNQTHKKFVWIIDLDSKGFEVDSAQLAIEVMKYLIKLFLRLAHDC